jgi:hypothetical protein
MAAPFLPGLDRHHALDPPQGFSRQMRRVNCSPFSTSAAASIGIPYSTEIEQRSGDHNPPFRSTSIDAPR